MANNAGQGLLELADLISRREYNWGIVRSRVYEEELVHNYADESRIGFTTLADTIDDLWKSGVISDKSRESLHSIRVLGNKAVHEGDNDPQDAKDAYFMLKQELQIFADRGNKEESDRTPVMINTSSDKGPEITEGEVYIRQEQRSRQVSKNKPEEIDMSYATNRRRPSGSSKSGGSQKKKKKKASGFDLYSVLRFLIPALIIVLVIILIKSLFPKKDPVVTPETSSAIETEAGTDETEESTEAATEAPTTEAPTTEASVRYQIKGEGVNIRLADEPGRIYTQLSTGTVIGEVTEYTGNSDYADFVKFTYDGKEVIVKKTFIEKAGE